MNRRQLLRTAPLAALSASLVAGNVNEAVALCFADPAETPVAALFREWEAIMERKKAGLTDQQIEALLDRQIEIEDRMMETAAQSRSDWIMKVMAYSTLGESGLPDHKDRPDLWAEARALVA